MVLIQEELETQARIIYMQQNITARYCTYLKIKRIDRLILLNLSKSSWKVVMEAVEKVKKRLAPEINGILEIIHH